MKRIIYLLFLVMLGIAGHAQHIGRHTYRLVDTADGLPDNEVKALFSTPDGCLGVRTSSSLSLYDGCGFRSFVPLREDAYQMEYVAGLPTAYVDARQRVWLKESGHLMVFDLTRAIYINKVETLLSEMGVKEHIKNLFVDSAKDFWIVTVSGRLLRVYGGKTEKEDYRCEWFRFPTEGLRDVCRIRGHIWLVYADGVLTEVDMGTKRQVRRQRIWKESVSLRDFVCFASKGDRHWLMWNHGIAVYQPGERQWQVRYQDEENVFTTMGIASDDMVYVAVRKRGLLKLSPEGEVTEQREFHTNSGESIVDDVETIVCGKDNLVLGLFARGICIGNRHIRMFPFYPFRGFGIDMSGSYRLSDGFSGLASFSFSDNVMTFDEEAGELKAYVKKGMDGMADCIDSYVDDSGRLWIGTFRRGLYIVDGEKTFHLMQGEVPSADINYNIVRGFVEDQRHRIYVSFHGGIGFFDERTRRIVPLKDKKLGGYKVVNDMCMDSEQKLWVATSTGLFAYSVEKKRVYLPQDIVGDQKIAQQMGEACKVVLADSRGLVWVGTLNGVYVIDSKRKTALRYGKGQGMPNEMIQGIIEDRYGDVWVATANGLCRFHSSGRDFTLMVFDSQNWLNDCKFMPLTAGYAAKGKLLFGCADGFYVVDPASVKATAYSGHPVFTSLVVNNQEIQAGREYDGRVILPRALSHTHRVVLRHDENFITIQFSGLNFELPHHTYYKYRLRGLSDLWTEENPADGLGKATYTNLSPGKYELEVYTAGFDMRWSEKPAMLTIVVEAPIWATWWAKLAYLLLLVGAVFWAIRWKMDQKRRQMENEKYKELEDLKYRFFTNISHEFRTLLTLIITPIGSLLRRTQDEEMRNQLGAVSKNAGDLLQLVNELLDFRKMEVNGAKLRLMGGNLNEFVEYTMHKFMPLSEQKGIALRMEDKTKGIFMQFDRDKMGKILVNLLSNAFKYTKSGMVGVVLEKCLIDSRWYARICVEDTGCGISQEAQEHIFDRFYRVESQEASQIGSGIGLNMVAEYVKLHYGRISVRSQVGKGSCFIVDIPTDLREEHKAGDASWHAASETKLIAKTILVVEDHDDFRNFLERELGRVYGKVLSAEDGIKGVLLAEQEMPDVVVSDVMMPRMSGTDLCRRLKENIKTSHVQVVLLTAWSTDEGRAEGYKAGADAYISKPFDMEVLLARIGNLLEKQEKRIMDFSHSISLEVSAIADSSPDEELLKTIIGLIEKNIDNTEYTIDVMARDVLMSRMSLYRKLKALTGQTPADFMRTVRLKLAAQLLESGKYNVSEVCYRTGFASPQNFSKCFKEMFGHLPSQHKA